MNDITMTGLLERVQGEDDHTSVHLDVLSQADTDLIPVTKVVTIERVSDGRPLFYRPEHRAKGELLERVGHIVLTLGVVMVFVSVIGLGTIGGYRWLVGHFGG